MRLETNDDVGGTRPLRGPGHLRRSWTTAILAALALLLAPSICTAQPYGNGSGSPCPDNPVQPRDLNTQTVPRAATPAQMLACTVYQRNWVHESYPDRAAAMDPLFDRTIACLRSGGQCVEFIVEINRLIYALNVEIIRRASQPAARFFGSLQENLSPAEGAAIETVIENDPRTMPSLYSTVTERSQFYGAVDAALQKGAGTRGIRFFGAAADVTNPFVGLGAIEQAHGMGYAAVNPEFAAMARDVNARLFVNNAAWIRRLLDLGYPFDARTPGSIIPVPPLVADLTFVQMEQALVEQTLRSGYYGTPELGAASYALNNRMMVDPVADWVRVARGKSSLDFGDIKDRQAIGWAMVFALHGYGPEEYLRYMQTGQVPLP